MTHDFSDGTNAVPQNWTHADMQKGIDGLNALRRRSIESIAKDESLTDEQMRFVATYVHTDAMVYMGSALWAKLQTWATRPGNEVYAAQMEARWRLCGYLAPDAMFLVRRPDADG